MERREDSELPKAEKTDWLIRQYFRAIYAISVIFTLGLAVGGTAIEVQRAVEGDFGKPLAVQRLPGNFPKNLPEHPSPSQKIITDDSYGLDIVVTGGAVVGVVGLAIMEGHRRLWLGKLMKLGTEPNK